MNLSIETYNEKYIEQIIELYNAETAFEPYIAPLNPERFIKLVEKKSYFDPTGLFIAVEYGKVVGWIHACVAPGSESWHNPENKIPHIRMLIYPKNRLKVGHALVSEANTWLKKSQQKKFLAIHAEVGYPFYRGLWLGGEPMGSSAMPHVQLAFEFGGYKTTQESILMTANMSEQPKEIKSTEKLDFITSKVTMKHKPMEESWIGFEPMITQVYIGDKVVGSIGWVMIPYIAEKLGAPCVNIWSLGISEEYRCKGIATALVSNIMVQSYKLGARFASVGTQFWNIPAHATYAKLGFIPYLMVIGRTLELSNNNV
ncbi:MAG: GNAT family N-acetyltransferase [bacterium]